VLIADEAKKYLLLIYPIFQAVKRFLLLYLADGTRYQPNSPGCSLSAIGLKLSSLQSC